MLSDILKDKKVDNSMLSAFVIPSKDELQSLIKERKQQSRRREVVETSKDPLQAAKDEATKILEQAQKNYDAKKAEANLLAIKKEAALKEELKNESEARFQAEIKSAKEEYAKSVEKLVVLKENLYRESEKQMMELVNSVIRKVLEREIRTAPDIVLDMLRKGFERVKNAKRYEIMINPVDYDLLLTKKEEVKEILKTPGSVKFQKDENIARGGCVIRTENGTVSSEPAEQVDIIMKELIDGN